MRSDSFESGKRLRRFLFMALMLVLMTPLSMSAQQISLSMKNVTVQEAITALNQSENYSIILNADEVDLNRRISVNARNASISEVLDQVFSGQKVSYVIDGRSISVTKKQEEPKASTAQVKRTIRGKVMDSQGEPLIGASLLVEGTKTGFLTDLDGNYEMTDISFPANVVVSFIGYSDQVISMKGNERVPFNICYK